jgi:hypothetical protein
LNVASRAEPERQDGNRNKLHSTDVKGIEGEGISNISGQVDVFMKRKASR